MEHDTPHSTLILGDCLDAMQGLPAGSIDAVIADPPYGMAYQSHLARRGDRFAARFDAIAGDQRFDPVFTVAWLSRCHRLLRDDSHLYVFCSDHHLGAFRQSVVASGFSVKRTLVWLKPSWTAGDLRGDYGHQTEFIVFAHKGRRLLNGQARRKRAGVPPCRSGPDAAPHREASRAPAPPHSEVDQSG